MKKRITVFEHQSIKLNQEFVGVKFDITLLDSFRKYYGDKGCPYFSLIHNGIKFSEYVGVIQIGNTQIEVLPKADKNPTSEEEKEKWRKMLINMIRSVGGFEIKSTSNSNLKIKPNSILDLYFEFFINEIEYLLHHGLLKQYRKKEGNLTSLKGSIQFGKHIHQNLTHQERFYVKYTNYNVEHLLHFIIYKTIRLLKHINTNTDLQSRIHSLLLYFPEMPDIKVSEATFNKIIFNRKTQLYKKAIDISKLILLQYHPDLIRGRTDMLALMFDMNKLWEKFVYISLLKHKKDITISAQTLKFFWKPENGSRSTMRPDIIINKGGNNYIVDTKWKLLNDYNPSPEDLRQMYVYCEYFGAKKVALIYPGEKFKMIKGKYINPQSEKEWDKECSIISLSVIQDIKEWQEEISKECNNWFNESLDN